MSASIINEIRCLKMALVAAITGNAPIDYTALLSAMLVSLTNLETNTDDIEATLTNILSDTTNINNNLNTVVVQLGDILLELQSIDENTDDVESILTDILNQLIANNVEPRVYVKLDDVCAMVDGVQTYVQPVVVKNAITGAFIATEYYSLGVQLTGTVTVSEDQCLCINCDGCEDPEVTACIRMDGFDIDRGLLQAGETTTYEIGLDGVNQATVVHDYTTSADGVNVSTWYTPIIAAINAVAGWTVTLVSDIPEGTPGKPTWQFEYTGATPSVLEIIKTPNGDVYTLSADGAGGLTGTALDNGNPFSSDPFDHLPCVPGDNSGGGGSTNRWTTTNGAPDMVAATTGWGKSDGSGDGSTYAEYKAALVADGYTIESPDADVPEIVVSGGATAPVDAKYETAGTSTFILTWVAA